MRRTEVLQEIRKMNFEDVLRTWTERRLTQEAAARMLGVCGRTFRRYIDRYHEEGLSGLVDKRLSQVSARKAPVDEVLALVDRYRSRYRGFTVKHYYSWYRREGGGRSYTWVKNRLQEAKEVARAPKRGAHRKRRERSPRPGMMLHQDGSTHEWVPGKMWDLIVTMDDATSEHYSMFFVEQEGTASSFRGVREVIESRGLFCSLYTDRGSHYWHTTEAGKVDRTKPTQFGRAMRDLHIEMIPAYSPEARGRGERAFGTHQGRLPKELAIHGITEMDEANRYVREVYLPAFNAEFMEVPVDPESAFVTTAIPGQLEDILCEQYERTVGRDNCVSLEGLCLQIPEDRYRCNYVKTKVRVHRYPDETMAIFHGPRKLVSYDANGSILTPRKEAAA